MRVRAVSLLLLRNESSTPPLWSSSVPDTETALAERICWAGMGSSGLWPAATLCASVPVS